jgi:SSS family transporter
MKTIHFTAANWTVLVSYIAGVALIGSLFYRKGASAAEYFLGNRRMGVLPVAISLVAADLSAITYLGTPAWSFNHNFELFLGTASIFVAAPVVMYLFLPFYSRLKLFSGYEYLEKRFDRKTRLLGASIFLLMRGAHVAIVIYAPSLVLAMLTGEPRYVCVLIIGSVTTAYTALGGMKAVIWTDVIQFSILVGGIGAVFWLAVSHIPGGITTILHSATNAGRWHMFNFTFDPRELTSVWAMVLGNGTLILATMGTDQAYLQRYFTTGSLAEGRRAVLLDALIAVPVCGALYLLGTVLFVYYNNYPGQLRGLTVQDLVLPYFVAEEMQGVLAGLVIASILASSMAVLSAGINSLTTVTTIDFYVPLMSRTHEQAETVRVARIGTVCWGTAATIAALFADRLGPLVNSFNLINSFLAGPLLGLFLVGMLSATATGTAAVSGATAGLAAVSIVAWKSEISFFYYGIVGLSVTVLISYIVGLWGARPNSEAIVGLVWGYDSPSPATLGDKPE